VKVYTSAQSLINWYTNRAHGHEQPWNLYTKDDDSCNVNMFIYLSFMLYVIYVTLIMAKWEYNYLVAINC
jgi:hypothetical protein